MAPSSAPGARAKATWWRLQEPSGKKWEGGQCGEQQQQFWGWSAQGEQC